MDIKTRISLDVLNEYSVTVKTQKYMELEAKNSALMAELEALKSSIDYASIKDKISKMF